MGKRIHACRMLLIEPPVLEAGSATKNWHGAHNWLECRNSGVPRQRDPAPTGVASGRRDRARPTDSPCPSGAAAHRSGVHAWRTSARWLPGHRPRTRGLPEAGGYAARGLAESGALSRHGRPADAPDPCRSRASPPVSEERRRCDPSVVHRRAPHAGESGRPGGTRRGAARTREAGRATKPRRRVAIFRWSQRGRNRGGADSIARDGHARLEARSNVAAAGAAEMTPERWRQVSRIYYDALARDSRERVSFLREACRDDDALRQEVESLLAQPASAEDFLGEPGLARAAELADDSAEAMLTGQRLGAYQVL